MPLTKFLIAFSVVYGIGADSLIDNIKSIYGEHYLYAHFHSKHPMIGIESTIFPESTNRNSRTLLVFTNYNSGTILSHQLEVTEITSNEFVLPNLNYHYFYRIFLIKTTFILYMRIPIPLLVLRLS